MQEITRKIMNELKDKKIYDGNAVDKITPEIRELITKLMFSAGLKQTQVSTILLLMKVSKGKIIFETTLEELAENFYDNYAQLKRTDVKQSKNLRSRIRCRLDYFVNKWKKKNNKIFFEILSKKCADDCAAEHTIKNPNPNIITIKLNLLAELLTT